MNSVSCNSPPIRTWAQFPSSVNGSSEFPDCASTPIRRKNSPLGYRKDEFCNRSLGILSPIDRFRLGIKQRRRELRKSFELNQTCPENYGVSPRKTGATFGSPSHCYDFGNKSTRPNNMDKIRVDGANGLRFSGRRSKGGFTPTGGSSPFSSSLINTSATNTTTTTTTSDSMKRISKSEINPNKAVFTIDSKTSRILIVNNNACELLGYSSKELCGMEFSNLLINKNNGQHHVSALVEGQLNSEDGTIVLLSGKVVEMTTKHGYHIAVSLWIRQIDTEGRCLAVAEPVERRVAKLAMSPDGTLTSGDYEALMLFQLDTIEDFDGMNINTLIPAIKMPDHSSLANALPRNVVKQKATGRTKDGIVFPLCLFIDPQTGHEASAELEANSEIENGIDGSQVLINYEITIWVFTNLSGLIVIDEHGSIESCNHHFSRLMFGYPQNKILGQHISKLIPNFGQELEFVSFSRSRNATFSSVDHEESETETDPVYIERTEVSERMSSCCIEVGKCLDFSSKVNSSIVSELSDDLSNIKSISSDTRSMQDGHPHEPQAMVKSVSDNLLCGQENYENNRNVANSVGRSKKSADGASDKPSVKPIPSVSSCDNEDNDHHSNNDNEILTPVNENDYYLTTATSQMQSFGHNHQHQFHHRPQTASHQADGDQNASQGNSNSFHSNMLKMPPTGNSVIEISEESIKSRLEAATEANPSGENVNINSGTPWVKFKDGKYKGEAVHNDGNVIDILYAVSSQLLPTRKVYCVWISRDPEDKSCENNGEEEDGVGPENDEEGEEEERNQNLTLTFDSVNSAMENNNSVGQVIRATAQYNVMTVSASHIGSTSAYQSGILQTSGKSRPNSMSLLSQCEEDQICGDFRKHYTTLKQIGKGAFGYVKMAYRNSDRLLVIAKFILKEKLCPQFMVLTEDGHEIPMEIYLLSSVVQHPNIVSVHDVFENDKFYQLVMEKHGCGMDLFEFIDRLPMMDEKLGCYIFRQIANAVDYLHSLSILHRDIKDENIIIDQNFHVKLIDFGSATFMEEGKLFSTFYGTTEYCSPEVLAGNKYAGPELEIWSLGVTLYVIIFFENPFVDIEETLNAHLVMPHKVSSQLEHLLYSILDKSPVTRCTMRDLLASPWMNQEIKPTAFDFSWVVPCEPYESNPEKYFNGQSAAVYSSGGVSTSPHDSLSLADAESMLDGVVVDDDDFVADDLSSDKKLESHEGGAMGQDGNEFVTLPPTVVAIIEPTTGCKGNCVPSSAKCSSSIEFANQSNRSNLQILSISYNRDTNTDEGDETEDIYDNDSWDEEDEADEGDEMKAS